MKEVALIKVLIVSWHNTRRSTIFAGDGAATGSINASYADHRLSAARLQFATVVMVVLAGALALCLLTLTACAPDARPEATAPSLAPLSDGDRSQLYEQQIDAARGMLLSAYRSATVPNAHLVRFVLPSEWAQVLESCMGTSGFSATARRDGGLEFRQPPEGQEEALSLAYYVCLVEYPMDPTYARPLNDEQVRYLYLYYTTELTPCLKDKGFDVSDPPSEATFVDQYSQAPWSPYDDVTTPSEDEWFALQENCPQMPEALFGPEP